MFDLQTIDSHLSVRNENELIGHLFFYTGDPDVLNKTLEKNNILFDLSSLSINSLYCYNLYGFVYLLFSFRDIKKINSTFRNVNFLLYPTFSNANINSYKLTCFFNKLHYSNCKIYVRRAVYIKSFFSSGSYETRITVDYPKQAWSNFISDLNDIDINIVSLDSTVSSDNIVFMVHLDSNGYIKVKRNFSFILNCLISYFSKDYNSELNILKNRNRINSDNYLTKPIIIKYPSDIFRDPDVFKLFISILSKIKNSSLSVYNSNPYFYGDLLDYHDGSSASIKVINQREILIIPQVECTAAFLDKIISYIFNNFRRGKLDYCQTIN